MIIESMETSRAKWIVRNILLLYLIAIFISTPLTAQNQAPACTDPTQMQMVLMELRSLRIELLHEKIERADARLTQLRLELQKAEEDRVRVTQMEQGQAEELAEFGQRLLLPGLTPQDRSEIEQQRSELMTRGAARLAERAEAAKRREADIRAQFGWQQQFRLQLEQMMRSLTGSAVQATPQP